ncbi:hypothetical protein [Geobacter argillaceus]|uniref:TraB family protein n=1 Tax=Geobacter argillaceus TaxID=345631 RepID=A0A562WS05_9BACT|nr:hypothetical protein [Geobacter argillaceus]TWJ33368.1 hypothetical protein JN12_00040 [Geobacter argillaceus]
MRSFANLFLLLFLVDGGVSLLDEAVSLLVPLAPLSGVRNLLANIVILMAVPLYLSLGIDRRLPKRLFLPLTIFAFFCLLSGWLFPPLAGARAYGLLTAAAQLALALFLLRQYRQPDGRPPALPAAIFAAPFFSLRNTLLFGTANLFVVPLALAMFALSAANAYMAEYTAGFMHLKPGGLYMTERVYRRDNRTIRLAGMIHVGEKHYYDDLARSVAPGRTIVLAEGVSDDGKLLRNRFGYGRVAGFLGLTSQDKMLFPGRLLEEEEFAALRPHATGSVEKEPAREPDILRADLDVSAFRPPTILVLDAIGKQLQESPSFVKGFLALNAWAEKNITPEMNEAIMDDILHRRNREVIRHLGKALESYDTVVVPWGALHMKEIEEEVLTRGFTLREERERVSIDFRKLLIALL